MVEACIRFQNNDAWEVKCQYPQYIENVEMTNKHKWALKSKYGNEVQHRSRPAPQGIPTYKA